MKSKLNSTIQKVNQLYNDKGGFQYRNQKYQPQTMNIEADEFQEILSWINDNEIEGNED